MLLRQYGCLRLFGRIIHHLWIEGICTSVDALHEGMILRGIFSIKHENLYGKNGNKTNPCQTVQGKLKACPQSEQDIYDLVCAKHTRDDEENKPKGIFIFVFFGLCFIVFCLFFFLFYLVLQYGFFIFFCFVLFFFLLFCFFC